MKLITSNLLKFAGTATLLAVIFRFCLSFGIENHSNLMIFLCALLYFLTMFYTGWYFGKKDYEHLPLYDVGFRFGLTTFLIHNLVSELWFIFGFNSNLESIKSVHNTAIIWGIFLLFHFIYFLWTRKRTIDHLSKDDLFE